MRHTRHYLTDSEGQEGATLIIFSIIITGMVLVGGMVLDHSRLSLMLTEIQNAADIAALSGARRLNGTKQGWQTAKKAAVLALKNNKPTEISSSAMQKILFSSGETNYWDQQASKNPGTTSDNDELKIIVERGLLHYSASEDGSESGYVFTSLETDPVKDPRDDSSDGKFYGNVRTYLIANAVRVTVTAKKLSVTSFGNFSGVSSFDNMTRFSVAVNDQHLDLPVAPLAIPICHLLLDTDVDVSSGDHLTADFQPEKQLAREIVFSDVNPRQNLVDYNGNLPQVDMARRDGMTRSDSYYRPPFRQYNYGPSGGLCYSEALQGPAHGCKELPVPGIIGIPTLDPGTTATSADITESFALAKTGGLRARIGMYFAPLLNVAELEPSAGDATADFLNSGSRTLNEVFKRATDYPPFWEPKENFPFVRTIRPEQGEIDPEQRPIDYDPSNKPGQVIDRLGDLEIGWPTKLNDKKGQQVFQKLILDHQEISDPQDTRAAGDWANPLLHDERIPLDPELTKVKEVYVMLIAPTVAFRGDGQPLRFCDFERTFSGKSPRATTPGPHANSKVVGYFPVSLFNFNYENLDKKFASTAVAKSQFVEETTATPYAENLRTVFCRQCWSPN